MDRACSLFNVSSKTSILVVLLSTYYGASGEWSWKHSDSASYSTLKLFSFRTVHSSQTALVLWRDFSLYLYQTQFSNFIFEFWTDWRSWSHRNSWWFWRSVWNWCWVLCSDCNYQFNDPYPWSLYQCHSYYILFWCCQT